MGKLIHVPIHKKNDAKLAVWCQFNTWKEVFRNRKSILSLQYGKGMINPAHLIKLLMPLSVVQHK